MQMDRLYGVVWLGVARFLIVLRDCIRGHRKIVGVCILVLFVENIYYLFS